MKIIINDEFMLIISEVQYRRILRIRGILKILDLCKITPVYNFINGRFADKPTVLKPLS